MWVKKKEMEELLERQENFEHRVQRAMNDDRDLARFNRERMNMLSEKLNRLIDYLGLEEVKIPSATVIQKKSKK